MPIDVLHPLVPLLGHFYCHAQTLPEWSDRTLAFIREEHLPMDEVNAHAGVLAAMPCAFENGYFSFNEEGAAAIVFEVYDQDDAMTVDLVAFSVDRPHIFGTAVGAAAVLGAARIVNPATWFSGPLPIFRTPLSWLRAGCQGSVVLDHRIAPAVLGEALGPLLAEDERHARDLKMMLCQAPVDQANILVPAKPTVRRAA